MSEITETITITGPESEQSWTFDVGMMLSGFGCIWGQGPDEGCAGAHAGTEHAYDGCCRGGTEITVEEYPIIFDRMQSLTEDDWQRKRENGIKVEGKQYASRVVAGKCIFLNDGNFAEGPGCAFHTAALRRNEDPLDWKPRACWITPFMVLEDEDDPKAFEFTIREREDWGEGQLKWWCGEDPVAWGSEEPLFTRIREELLRLLPYDIFMTLEDHLHDRMREFSVSLVNQGTPVEINSKPVDWKRY